MSKEEIIQMLKENLRIEVETTSEYNGGMGNDGSMYSDSKTIKLVLFDEVISYNYL
jgi:hypothetical protein